jgi:TRAP transporter 4TM/12TM fusion protein
VLFNDTMARSIHLSFAVLLVYLCYPAYYGAPRKHVPLYDWAVAFVATFCASYLFFFHAGLSVRQGSPNTMDIWVACAGVITLLEATRRGLGKPMMIMGIACLVYVFAGRYMPDMISHKGATIGRAASHFWITTEGVFGVALGVSTSFVFLYVLFGAMLDQAGAGNYLTRVSFALMGHMRGGPAKASVLASGFNGMISGSSVANVLTGGNVTIMLMKRVGYSPVKAGAIEVASSSNGQIMPPVMGAAAFLMVEYINMPYSEIVKHAFLPAILAYVSLFYIVHLEALKMDMKAIAVRSQRSWQDRLMRNLIGVSGSIVVVGVLYYLLQFFKDTLGAAAPWAVGGTLLAMYLYALREAARCPDLPEDIDINNPKPLETWPTVRAGLHYIIPIGVLIWCLMVEEMSPALSAFWAVTTLIVLMLTQRPLIDFFRGIKTPGAWLQGWESVVQGFNDGARNMIGIGIATATAGIIVGAITLTGLGLRMTEFVEFVSHGNVMLMLLFIAFVCLVLGMGVPTTANYVLVATLMAPVAVELGAQAGLVIPLIAVHLFVFYYGIMGDITPPVGLATFAASAISGEDSIATGIQGALYALRTVILPFIWIFNPQLLLIDVHGWGELILVVTACSVAMLVFAALTMNWLRIKLKWWEFALLALSVALLFRPGFFMDRLAPEYTRAPASQVYELAQNMPDDGTVVMLIKGTTLEGEDVTKTVSVQLGDKGKDGRARLSEAGLTLMPLGDDVQVGAVKFGSRAKRSGFEQGWDITGVQVPTGRPSKYWFALPGFLLAALVWWLQGRRMRATNGIARR